MPNFTGDDRASERAPFYDWLTAFCRAMGACVRVVVAERTAVTIVCRSRYIEAS